MDRKRWILSFIFAVLAVLAVDYFFFHFLFPVKREAVLHELQERVQEEIRKNPAGPLPDVPNPGLPEEIPAPRQEQEAP